MHVTQASYSLLTALLLRIVVQFAAVGLRLGNSFTTTAKAKLFTQNADFRSNTASRRRTHEARKDIPRSDAKQGLHRHRLQDGEGQVRQPEHADPMELLPLGLGDAGSGVIEARQDAMALPQEG